MSRSSRTASGTPGSVRLSIHARRRPTSVVIGTAQHGKPLHPPPIMKGGDSVKQQVRSLLTDLCGGRGIRTPERRVTPLTVFKSGSRPSSHLHGSRRSWVLGHAWDRTTTALALRNPAREPVHLLQLRANNRGSDTATDHQAGGSRQKQVNASLKCHWSIHGPACCPRQSARRRKSHKYHHLC
jgi:hypothetical protein